MLQKRLFSKPAAIRLLQRNGKLPPSEQVRHINGIAIEQLESSIKRINKLRYQVRSQSDLTWSAKDAKRKVKIAKAIIHDGLLSYDKAFQKEFYIAKNPRVRNIRSKSVRNQDLNSKVERLYGTMRERDKVMRGLQRRKTAQHIVDTMRIHYDFIREHQTLEKTPAEKAGIGLNLKDNKVENLIRLAATFKRA